MTWPAPQPGLVIRYAYLWRQEAEAGREDGSKDRPCAVILSVTSKDEQTIVYVLPITHRPPRLASEGLELPAATKVRLGLDGDRSWVVLTEANVFAWPGPDLRLIHGRGPDGVAYGMLPPKLLQVIKARFVEHMRRGAVVKRSE